ncbi:MAG TPA: cytochrome c biogenesis protein CcsA [Anaeromyxobacteraceae bacterium]|nr:cytochrome c biogenesis protein CcsA [Anaeromyxobacteraceae bacterium]
MSVWILRFAAALYLAAAAAYVFYFARPRHTRAASAGYTLVGAGFLVHAISIGFACSEFRGAEFFTLRGGLVMIAWLAAGGFLLLIRAYRLPAIGAFITPLLLMALVPGLFAQPGQSHGIVPEVVRLPVLKLHVIAATGAVGLFAIAFGVALMYLLQERELKGKRFGALFSRLPSLTALDRLNQRMVRSGFVIYTIALVSGTLTAKTAWGRFFGWDLQQVISLGIWLLFALMVQLRHSGIHGRKYAVLTVVGFVLVMGTMVGLRQAPGLTRHEGSYAADRGSSS